MQITNLNPRDDIGASAWHIQLDQHGILLDTGIHPKLLGHASLPQYQTIQNKPVHAIALTHCHHDHVGSLPIAIRHFPKARILMTDLSTHLIERVLHNSVNVMKTQRDELNIPEYPLYTHNELDQIAPHFQPTKYNQPTPCTTNHNHKNNQPKPPTIEFLDAGHVLGSAGILIRGQNQTLFYTGDTSIQNQTILKGAQFHNLKPDILILETTRGNRNLPPNHTRQNETNRLTQQIQNITQHHGAIMIPTFALGRTQEILTLLALMMQQNKIKKQPIYIGGLGRIFTQIYDQLAPKTNRSHTNLNLQQNLNLIVLEKHQQQTIKLKSGRLFVLTAGMMTENTPAHQLALRMIQDPRQAIFFVGYADPDTPAGRLRATTPGQTFHFSQTAGTLTRHCQIQEFDLTAHANRNELLNLITQTQPRAIILTHGEPDSRAWFAQQIQQQHPQIKTYQPQPGQTIQP